MVPKVKIFGPTNADALIDGLIRVVFEKKKKCKFDTIILYTY